MKQVGKYNTISKELLEKIPPLAVGETALFEMLTGVPNNEPDLEERRKSPVLYPKSNIPLRDRIKDGNTWVDIVVAESWNKEEPIEDFFMPGKDDGHLFSGKFQLVGGNQRDEEIYQLLMLSNYNRDSVLGENRDKGKPVLFARIDTKANSKKTLNSFNILKEAITLIEKLTPQQAREIGASLNWNEYTDDQEILAEVANFARTKPEEFLKVYNDPSKDTKSTIKMALDGSVLTFDMQSGMVSLGTEEITKIAKQDRGNVPDALTKFLVSAKNGQSVLDNIKKQLKEK